MGCEDSELWITYHQNSRGEKLSTTQLIELEFQSHKLIDLEDVLDHVFAQGWVESHYRSVAWWEKRDGTKLKNSERIDSLLKRGVGKCDSSSLKLVIGDSPPTLWISYVFLKGPNTHASVQRINLVDAADQCCKIERLGHVSNYIFRKGYLPANVRSFVHWEDGCKRRIEEHTCVKELLCDRGTGWCEDKPIKLVIGSNFALAVGGKKIEADSGSFKTNPPAPAPAPVPANAELPDAAAEAVEAELETTVQQESPPDSLHVIPPPVLPETSFPTSLVIPSSSPDPKIFPSSSKTFCASTTPGDTSTLYSIHLMLFGTFCILSWTAAMCPHDGGICENRRFL